MPCEKYREALIEVAANGPMPEVLRVHLGACASCRETLREEQELFAAIDFGVQRMANAEVPPSLLPRVRASLERGVSERRSFWPYAVLAGAAVCAVLIFVGVREWRIGQVASPVTAETNHENLGTKSPAPLATQSEKTVPLPSQRRMTAGHVVVKVQDRPQVAVLVPAGQKQEVDRLLVMLQRGNWKPGELRAENAQAPSADLSVMPLSIAPIEMKPLATVGEDAEAAVEKTKI
jgi:hypothetical protein